MRTPEIPQIEIAAFAVIRMAGWRSFGSGFETYSSPANAKNRAAIAAIIRACQRGD